MYILGLLPVNGQVSLCTPHFLGKGLKTWLMVWTGKQSSQNCLEKPCRNLLATLLVFLFPEPKFMQSYATLRLYCPGQNSWHIWGLTPINFCQIPQATTGPVRFTPALTSSLPSCWLCQRRCYVSVLQAWGCPRHSCTWLVSQTLWLSAPLSWLWIQPGVACLTNVR